MALEITTVGASVKYKIEATAGGARPTSGYTALTDVNSAPEIPFEYEALPCSNISDTVSKYTRGRKEPPGSVTFTLNHTEAAITGWNAMVTAFGSGAGKRIWIEYAFAGATNSFFFLVEPCALGSNGIEQNTVDTLPAVAIVADVEGWAAKST